MNTVLMMGMLAITMVTDPYGVLRERSPSPTAVAEARELLMRKCVGDEQNACVDRLVEIWANGPWTSISSLSVACELATDAAKILDAVSKKASDPDPVWKERVTEFFVHNAPVLVGRVQDAKPVVELAVKSGFSITGYPISQELLDWGLAEEIRQNTKHESGGGSYAAYLSSSSLPKLREFLRQKLEGVAGDDFASHLNEDGVQIALDTLAEFSDPDLLPIVDGVLKRLPSALNKAQAEKLRIFAVKLRFQDDKKSLLDIVRTEHGQRRLLTYAVWRLLQLGVDWETVQAALAENEKAAAGQVDDEPIATAVLRTVFGSGGDLGPFSESSFDPLILNAAEFDEYLKMVRAARKESATTAAPAGKGITRYSLKAVRDRAPKKQGG